MRDDSATKIQRKRLQAALKVFLRAYAVTNVE
jgi:hypothetical protein